MLYIKWTQFALESRFIAALKNLTQNSNRKSILFLNYRHLISDEFLNLKRKNGNEKQIISTNLLVNKRKWKRKWAVKSTKKTKPLITCGGTCGGVTFLNASVMNISKVHKQG